MIKDLLKENSELLYKVGIKKYINYKTNQLEIDLSDFKIFNDNKKEIGKFYLYGVIYNKKIKKYMEEDGKFRFTINNSNLNDSTNILRINNTKLIFKTIKKFDNLYNSLDYDIHFLLIPIDDKFFNVIVDCESLFDTFLLKEIITIKKIKSSSESALKKLLNSFKILYYLIPFLVIVILQVSVSYYIINSGGFSWEIVNSSFIISTCIYFFIYFFSQFYIELGILHVIYLLCILMVCFFVLSPLSVISYFICRVSKFLKKIINIIRCNKNEISYLIEDININTYKIHKNNTFKTFHSFFLTTFALPILILLIYTIFIITIDIININNKNTKQIEKSFNIIYAISKEYISKTSFPELIKTNTGQIAVLMNSNEYESEIYTINEINSVINKSKNNCDFENTFNKYFFRNNSDSKIFKNFYLAFLFGNMDNLSTSKIKNNDYTYLLRQSKEYLENMNSFEELLFK